MNETNASTAPAVDTVPPEPPAPEVETEPEDAGPGIYLELGKLPPATLVSEDGLARLLGKSCRDSVKRAIERGELPRPVKLMGKNTWTIGYLCSFFEKRLDEEARKITRLRTPA
jgi:hypothetical protein